MLVTVDFCFVLCSEKKEAIDLTVAGKRELRSSNDLPFSNAAVLYVVCAGFLRNIPCSFARF